MGRRGRSARWGRTSAGCSSGRQALGWVAIAAPGRVVLWPALAGLPCRRRRGWDHTSIPRPRCGVFSLVGGLIARRLASEAKGTAAGAAWGQAPGLMGSSPRQPGSLLLIGDKSTTGSTGISFPNVDTPSTGVAPVESSDVGGGPPVTRLRIWRLGVRIPRGAHQSRRSAPCPGSLSRVRAQDCDQLRPRRRPLRGRLRPPATNVAQTGFTPCLRTMMVARPSLASYMTRTAELRVRRQRIVKARLSPPTGLDGAWRVVVSMDGSYM
jgi:hypothetical protein